MNDLKVASPERKNVDIATGHVVLLSPSQSRVDGSCDELMKRHT